MTRFEILEHLAFYPGWTTAVAIRDGGLGRGSLGALHVQLNRMWRCGLVRRTKVSWDWSPTFRITMKGRARLAWARKQGLI